MTGELDEKAVMAAHEAYAKTTGGLLDGNPMANAIRAYLAASPSPSMEMGVVATAWEGYWPGAGSINSTTKLTKDKNTAARWQDDGAEIEPLVTLSSAQSALAAMRAERDEYEGLYHLMKVDRDNCSVRAKAAEAQVQRLTEENEALRKVVRCGREMAPDVMRALLSMGGRDNILLADRVHKADDAARSALKENAL